MKKNKMETMQPYVPPRVEVYAVKADSLLIGGTHHDAVDDGGFSTAGAKESLDFDIKFNDVWEEWPNFVRSEKLKVKN